MEAHCAELVKFSYAMAVAQTDIWEAPNKTHWIAVIMHSVDENFIKKRVFFHFSNILEKIAQAQGQRIITSCKKYEVDVSQFLWTLATDNTPSAYNVAECLKLEILRCGAHIIALGQKNMFYPQRRQKDGNSSTPLAPNKVNGSGLDHAGIADARDRAAAAWPGRTIAALSCP